MQPRLHDMKTNRTCRLFVALVLALTTGSVGCASSRAASVTGPAGPRLSMASAVKRASGSACGIDLLNIVPIGLTNRAERARRNAIEASGAKTMLTQSLTDTSVDLMVATIQCSSVGGTAAF